MDRSDLLCLSSDINYSLEQGKSRAIVEVKDKKPSTKKKKKNENEFTHEEESREENDAQLPNSKPRNFQTKWLNDHRSLRYENNRIFCHFFRLARKKNPFGGDKGLPRCCLFVPLQGPQRDKLSPEAIKLAQTLLK